jgi:hypothetical protein
MALLGTSWKTGASPDTLNTKTLTQPTCWLSVTAEFAIAAIITCKAGLLTSLPGGSARSRRSGGIFAVAHDVTNDVQVS